MPNYDYFCKACEQEVEIFHSVNDTQIECPLCKEENRLQKLVTAPSGITFSGSGFYETDYKRKTKSEGDSSAQSGSSCKHQSACACK